MDKGFELMIPKKKSSKREFIFANRIRFCIFNKEFNLSFNVKQKQE